MGSIRQIGLGIVSTLLVIAPLGAPPTASAKNTCSKASISFSPPLTTFTTGDADGTVNGDTSTDETITGSAYEATSGTGCDTGTNGTAIQAGKLNIEQTEGGTTCAAPSFSSTFFASDDDLSSPPTNSVTGVLDTSTLGGQTIGFRTHYIGGNTGFKESKSPCVDLVVSAAANCSDGTVHLTASSATASGTPTVGSTLNYSYTMTVRNCTGSNLTGVKVQGGTSGWTTFDGFHKDDGDVSLSTKNKTTVVTWTVDLDDQETRAIEIDLKGAIKNATPIGTVLYLSGPWSAAYILGGQALKSDYTGRVSVTVE